MPVIHVHVTERPPKQWMAEVTQRLAVLDRKLDRIERKLGLLQREEEIIMSDLTALQSSVTANGDVEQSAIVLLNGLAEALRAAATDPAAIQALADQITAQSSSLAEAVVANTPAA